MQNSKLQFKTQTRTTFWFCVFLCFCVFVFSVNTVFAQGIAVNVSPENPRPGDKVTVELSSFLSDLDRAQISWKKDGKEELVGVGKTKFNFTVGDTGEVTTLEVTITFPTGTKVTRNISIAPQGVDLLWEAPNSYVPPFYRGKALPASEALIRVAAIPTMRSNGLHLRPENLVYSWKRDFSDVISASGYAKNLYSFTHDVFAEQENIGVEVSPLERGVGASGSIAIRPFAPKILFYKKDGLEGIQFQRALNLGFDMENDTATIVAQPFFFSPKDSIDANLDYTWNINEEKIDTPEKKNELVLRIGERGGIATLSLTIDHLKKVFQDTTGEISINLGI